MTPPRTLFPWQSGLGENAAMPICPGSAPIRPPATPLLAGMPTWVPQSPAASYIPQLNMTLSTWRTTGSGTTCSPERGFIPRFANVAAIMARSRVLTSTEHWRV
ncbi:hypothetical protein GCM10010221_51440 [Streptomyces parvus]|nr:hypothetical protein GCM10010221_51440 [Streptomyces parvus]